MGVDKFNLKTVNSIWERNEKLVIPVSQQEDHIDWNYKTISFCLKDELNELF